MISNSHSGFAFAVGIFYAFFPHTIHVALQKVVGYDKPVSHGVHVIFGFTFLIIMTYITRNSGRIDNRLGLAILAACAAGLIDSLFHYIFTQPFENWFYFAVKILLLVPTGYYLSGLKNFKSNPLTYATIGALTFSIAFSVYYRINEYVKGQPFGSRVPDINILGRTITYSDNMLLSALVWGSVHFFAYLIPGYILFSGKV